MSPEEITAGLSPEQKAAQMVMPAIYRVSADKMKDNGYGSIDAASWRSVVDRYQNAALLSDAGIPFIYGQDDVHGVNYCINAVYFPHNIGQGAANDEELAYQVGLITADEAKLCHETLGCKTTSVSVAIKDIPEENWKEQVWDKSIVPDDQYLYKRPGYTCE